MAEEKVFQLRKQLDDLRAELESMGREYDSVREECERHEATVKALNVKIAK